MATTHAAPSNTVLYPPAPKRGKHGKPVAVVKFGSASVPVYRCDSGGRVRFGISHYRDGKRLRKFFTTLTAYPFICCAKAILSSDVRAPWIATF